MCQLQRFSSSSGLGLSLEARAGHHYLCSVLPEGPVGQSGRVFTGDQILEVGHLSLIHDRPWIEGVLCWLVATLGLGVGINALKMCDSSGLLKTFWR